MHSFARRAVRYLTLTFNSPRVLRFFRIVALHWLIATVQSMWLRNGSALVYLSKHVCVDEKAKKRNVLI